MNDLRICKTCSNEKHFSEFYRDSRYPNGDIHCKECRKEKVKKWRRSNPARAKEIAKISRSKNPEKSRARANEWHKKNRGRHLAYMANRRLHFSDEIASAKLKAAFGITLDEYNQMLKSQSFMCAICGKHQNENGKRLAVDHCHKTLKVRGLLCSKCNQAIGLFSENISVIQSAIQYIQKHTT